MNQPDDQSGAHSAAEHSRPHTIAAALVAAQRNAQGVAKNARNKHHSYNYASSDAVIAAGREYLTSAGLSLTRTYSFLVASPDAKTVIEREAEDARFIGLSMSAFVLRHENGESIVFPEMPYPVLTTKGRPADKALGAALTTSLAYFLRDLLLLDKADEDVDSRSDGASVGAANAPKATPPKASQTQQSAPSRSPIPATVLDLATEDEQAKMRANYPNGMTADEAAKAEKQLRDRRAKEAKAAAGEVNDNGEPEAKTDSGKPAPASRPAASTNGSNGSSNSKAAKQQLPA